MAPSFVPQVKNTSDVQNVDQEFLEEAPEETPVQASDLAVLACEEGNFDNFTFVNENNMSELEGVQNGNGTRAQTELQHLKNSFAEPGVPSFVNSANDDSQQAGAA